MSVPTDPHEWDIKDVRRNGEEIRSARHGYFKIKRTKMGGYLLTFSLGTFNTASEAAQLAHDFAKVLDALGIKRVVRD